MSLERQIDLARAYRRRLFADLEGSIESTECLLDKPEDRLYHAEDRTWWRREGFSLKAADPPPEIHALQSALAQAIRQGCICDQLYGATCNIHRLETPAGIQEAVDHLKALEEAVRFTKEFLQKQEFCRNSKGLTTCQILPRQSADTFTNRSTQSSTRPSRESPMSDLAAGPYYIQNVGFCGNCLRWWRPDGHGYTSDLRDAWKVDQARAEQLCHSRPKEDIMWPVAVADAVAQLHVTGSLAQALMIAAERGVPNV
jgi:hypothetical protein